METEGYSNPMRQQLRNGEPSRDEALEDQQAPIISDCAGYLVYLFQKWIPPFRLFVLHGSILEDERLETRCNGKPLIHSF